MQVFTKLRCKQARLLQRRNFTRYQGGIENLKAFESKIRALSGICHRNIVKLYGYVHIHGSHSGFTSFWKEEA